MRCEHMDNFDGLFDEMLSEYPSLAEAYDYFMSGEFDEERISHEYAQNENFRNLVDKAKGKYLVIFQDMGLFKD